ncbi:MAG TPA: NTF2 fold immunity protein [Rhizomicrobium sp.]|nr:NTF2 fold immunity protein [Rhizomicrobium sp.]
MNRALSTLALTAFAYPVLAQPAALVPDAKTAISIARAVLTPIYGPQVIQAEEPLIAVRQDDVWVVRGTLNCPHEKCLGGTAELKLSAKDGRILHVIHGK